MRLNPVRMMISLCLVAAVLMAAGCSQRRRMMLTEEKFPPTPASQEVKLFVNEVRRPHVEIAIVQSFSDPNPDADTKRRMLEELTKEARRVGGDAVMNIRQLKSRVRGAVVDEAVPFRAYKQGRYDLFFLRGTAIKFVDEAEAVPTGPDRVAPTEPASTGEGIPDVLTIDPEEDYPYEVVPKGLGPAY